MSELHSLYESRLEDLGNAKSVNKTRLKERLVGILQGSSRQFDGRNTFLVFKEGIRNMIQNALKKRDFSEDALILARAASIIRKDIFNHEGILFNGSFPEKCQDTSLPSSLKTLISSDPLMKFPVVKPRKQVGMKLRKRGVSFSSPNKFKGFYTL